MRKMMLAGATALAMVSTAALASVTFDPTTGVGFVGKGDVQTAFGWNNAAAQANTPGVTFRVDASAEYDVVCEWDTVTGGKKKTVINHKVTNTHSVSSQLAVDAGARKTGQFTGWFLNGYSDGDLSIGDLPAIGDSCPQGGSSSDNDPPANDAVVTDAYWTSAAAGTLSAVHNNVANVIYSFTL